MAVRKEATHGKTTDHSDCHPDGEHVRFVQPDVDNVLRTIGSLDSASAHARSRDIGSDRPGRSFESGAGARHAVGQRAI